jgi:hypothetical protein
MGEDNDALPPICRRRNESNFLGGEGSDGMLNLERKKTVSLKERKGILC